MKVRIRFFISLFIFWFLVQIASKLLFVLYHLDQLKLIGYSTLPEIFLYGLKLDLSATGYMMALPALLLVFLIMTPGKIAKPFFDIYVLIMLIIMGFLLAVDMELYSHWGFRLDRTPLLYIDNPDIMMASVETYTIVKQIIIMILFSGSLYFLYHRFVSPIVKRFKPEKFYFSLVFLLLLGLLIIPVRGGFGIAPVNVGTAYFHPQQFANHAAINCYWHLGYSLSKIKSDKNPYDFFSREEAEKCFSSLFQPENKGEKIIRHPKPNIVLIVIESFTAKIIEPLGGLDDVTPNFSRLSAEGILFENIYASGDRTDKGFVAIMSGYPAQPESSVIKLPQKTQKLPNMCRILSENEYYTYFCYGGDADFANFRSYLTNSGFNKITSLSDFDRRHNTFKWGVHDHIVIDKFFEDMEKIHEPFFSVLLTQSSHEPFEVPHQSKFKGRTDDELFLNSANYTDSCLGVFFEKARLQDWYENTLFILIPDHGHRLPGNNLIFEPQRFHIPMIWLGSVLESTSMRIPKFGSQFDLATTLLNQLGYDTSEFIYGKDLLDKQGPSHSFYVFNNGFGFVNDSATVAFDNRANNVVYHSGNEINVQTALKNGKVFLQVSFEDFLRK